MLGSVALFLFGPHVIKISAGSTASEIQAKIDAAVAHRKNGQRIEVQLPKGRTFLDHGLVVRAANISLVGGSSTILTGAVPLLKWSPLSDREKERFPEAARRHILVSEVPDGFKLGSMSQRGFALPSRPALSELLIDDKPMTLARFPNLDAPQGGWQLTGEKSEVGNGFKDLTDRPLRWAKPAEAWTYGYWRFDWADGISPIREFNPSTHEVKIGDPADSNQGALSEWGVLKGRRFFYLNVPEELDQAGEYWVDTANRKVYAWLPAGGTLSSLSVCESPLITVEKADGVQVRGVILTGGRGTAVEVKDSSEFLLRQSTITAMGGAGVTITGGHHSGVENAEISNCGESGVALSGGDFETLTPAENYVMNSRIHAVSRWCRTYHPAVNMDGVGQRIIGNTLTDLPHNAILFGGNDHLIERNDIQRVCLETGDSGAIYAGRNPTTRGTMIRNNRFRDIEPHTNTEGNYPSVICVYLDDALCGISIAGNVFEAKGIGIMIGGGRDNIVSGNVFLDTQPGISFDQRGKGWAKDEFWGSWEFAKSLKQRPIGSDIWRKKYPALHRDFAAGLDLALATGNVVEGNVHSGARWIDYLDGLTVKDLDYRDNLTGLKGLTLAELIKMVPAKYGKIDLKKIGK